jgi:segregation and condensation protein A
MTDSTDYEVKLEIFEGPLDLLLHLIRKNEVDIFDIPIAMITDQYLEYLDMMKALNISMAGEFLLIAATLMHIKSRMLLPASDDEDEEDPRDEITRPLLEYLQLKEAAGELSGRELLDRDVFARRLSQDSLGPFMDDEPLLQASLFQLIDAFKRIVDRQVPGAQLTFLVEEWSLKEKTNYIIERLKEKKSLSELIVTFLALLELIQMRLVRAFQHDPDKDIMLEGRFEETEDGENG